MLKWQSMQITLKDITKYYYDSGKSTKSLEGINLSFTTDGSFVAVTGESGAGKTTLIKILTGIEDFDEGEIYFDNEPISGADDKRRNKLYSDNVSFVFQDYSLVESLTAKENIVLALLKKGYEVRRAKQKAVEVLDKVGLTKQINMKASKLSGGEKQRVAIARSLALDTKIVVFDEPTGNLDNQTSKGIIDLIKSIRPGRLIIYITHDFDIVKPYITRHIVLADGHVVRDEQVNENIYKDVPTIKDEPRDFHKFTYLYASYLMNFKKMGRILSSFFLVLLSTVIVLGIFIFAGSFTTYNVSNSGSYENTVFNSPLGNEVFLAKDNPEADNVSTEEGEAVDQGSILLNNLVSIYTEDRLRLLEKDHGINSVLSGLLVISDSDEAQEFKLFEGEDGNLKDGEFSFLFSDAEEQYIRSNSYYSVVSDLIGQTVGIANNQLNYYQDYSDVNSDIMMTDDSLSDNEFSDFVASIPRLKLKNIKITPKIIVSSSSSAYVDENKQYYYQSIIVNKNTFQTIRAFFESIFDLNVEKGGVYFSLNSGLGGSGIYLNIDDNEDFSTLTNANSFNNPLTYDRTKYGLVLPAYYKDRDVSLTYKNITYDIDAFSPLYLDEDYTKGIVKGSYHLNYPFIQKQIITEKFMTTVYFKNAESAKKYASSIKQAGIRVNYGEDANSQQSSYAFVDFADMSIQVRVSVLMSLGLMLIAFFIIMLVIRLIMNKFYYRKNDDQKVLSLIGYSLKDNMIINTLQFVILFVVSVAVIYPIWFTYIPLSSSMFKAIPGVLLFLTLIDFLLVVSLGLPTRKRMNTL